MLQLGSAEPSSSTHEHHHHPTQSAQDQRIDFVLATPVEYRVRCIGGNIRRVYLGLPPDKDLSVGIR
jgi:hypothetical protein